MTDLEKRAEKYCCYNFPTTHTENMVKACVEFAQSESALLSQHILDLQRDKGNLTDKIRKLENQLEWHDLEKNPNDLPKDRRNVWCDYGDGYGKGFYHKDDGGWWIEGHMFCSAIDAWCELPTRNKEIKGKTYEADELIAYVKKLEEENEQIKNSDTLCKLIGEQKRKIAELERKLEQTEKDLADYQFNYPTIKELETQIEKMKSQYDYAFNQLCESREIVCLMLSQYKNKKEIDYSTRERGEKLLKQGVYKYD